MPRLGGPKANENKMSKTLKKIKPNENLQLSCEEFSFFYKLLLFFVKAVMESQKDIITIVVNYKKSTEVSV